MKSFSLFVCVCAVLSWTACNSDGGNTTGNQTTFDLSSPTYDIPMGNGRHTLPLEITPYAPPVLPNTEWEEVQLLLSTYWVAEFWVNHADASTNKINAGRWWKFEPDGTFTTGRWEEVLAEGSWVVYPDEKYKLLHLDANINRLDMEFEMQNMSYERDIMSWAGTGLYDMSRIAVKAISLLTQPTRKQFGIEEDI